MTKPKKIFCPSCKKRLATREKGGEIVTKCRCCKAIVTIAKPSKR